MSTSGGPEQPEQPGQPEPPGPNPYQPQQQNPYYPQGQPQQPYYGQTPYQQPYQQQGYPQAPYGYPPPPPNHPSANTAMVLGIVALAGLVTCGGITLVLSPFAWGIGSKAVREIDANPTMYGGRSSANAGKVMGIIGTVLLILGIIAIVGIIALAVATSDSSTTFDNTNT